MLIHYASKSTTSILPQTILLSNATGEMKITLMAMLRVTQPFCVCVIMRRIQHIVASQEFLFNYFFSIDFGSISQFIWKSYDCQSRHPDLELGKVAS